jgi:molybdopterin/thiamine biosynthesis adenylyltransferase
MGKNFSTLRLAKQRKLFGKECMDRLKSIKLAVIGCGRNGSFFSILCAYTGFFNFLLVDPDVVRLHNVNASILFGYKDVGRRKVEVVKERIQSVDPAISCEILPFKVQNRKVLSKLKSCDVIVSAVDSISTKKFLNSFVAKNIKDGYPISLLELGSGAYVKDGKILLLGGQATLFTPGGACLLCGPLDEDEFTNLSNVSFIIPNGLSALLGLELLLSYLTGYDNPLGDERNKYNFILYDCLSHKLVKFRRIGRKDCKYCGFQRGKNE